MRLILPVTFLLGGLLGAAVAADPVRGHVVSVDAAPLKTAPHGKASIRVLSGEAESAFVGMLSIDAGVTIPVHRDASEEFIYMIEGGGVIRIDGVESPVGPGDFVFMPANSEVTFAASDAGPSRALQVFAPTESAAKYDGWE
ncbi:MAG: quercetin dioxygenase-like cupin family protein [Myxococcota bacterium]|jgi:quercetin dioxygenase-like cupin family protein